MDKRTEAAQAVAVALCRRHNLAVRDAANLAPECSDEDLDLAALALIDAICDEREVNEKERKK